MINPKVFKAVLLAATKENKDLVLEELAFHISNNYDYGDAKAGHIVEMLMDKETIVTKDKVNLKWIEQHPERLTYSHDKYNFRNIEVEFVDNIECTIRVKYEYLEKINEDRDDVSYTSSYFDINFNDYPEILK